MDIVVSKVGDEYSFAATEHVDGNQRVTFDSLTEAFYVKGLRPTYKFMGEAHWVATKLANFFPSFFSARKAQVETRNTSFSADEALLTHFNTQLDILKERFRTYRVEADSAKERQAALQAIQSEAQMVMQSLDDMIKEVDEESEKKPLLKLKKQFVKLEKQVAQKIGPSKQKTAATEDVGPRFKNVVCAFAEEALDALHYLDDTVKVGEFEYDEENQEYLIRYDGQAGPICTVVFNNDALLVDIVPYDTEKIPFYSKKFFCDLFEPIVYATGHFFDTDRDVILLPNHPDSKREEIMAFRAEDKQPVSYRVNYVEDGDRVSWWNRVASCDPEIKKQAVSGGDGFLGQEIKFTNPEIKTLYGRTGMVTDYDDSQPDLLLLTVDFRRGLGAVTVNSQDVVLA